MTQKPLLKASKKIEKKPAANRHGKSPKTKKGRLEVAPKKPKVVASIAEDKELTKAINKNNESMIAAKAEHGGKKLKTVMAPPVLAPKNQKKKAKGA